MKQFIKSSRLTVNFLVGPNELVLVFILLHVTFQFALAAPSKISPYIKYDQFGYLPGMRKVAVVADPIVGYNAAESFTPGTSTNNYEIRRWSDDVVVYQGTLTTWLNGATHTQSGDRGWHYDFSSVRTPGSYYIFDKIKNVGSGRFEISSTVYNDVLKQAVRMYYYQRLNTPKVVPYAGTKWTEAAAFERPGQDRSATSQKKKGDISTAKDLSGGWMDAGDTNKYTTFAESAILQLLDAYRANPAIFGDDFNIPESGNGVSDLLDEIKWELEFLKKMQTATGNGGFLLKLGEDNYNSYTPPSVDPSPRYYLPECTSATIAGSAMFALASQVYKTIPSQSSFASDLLDRAETAWERFRVTTANFTNFQTNCDDGDIKSGDADVDQSGQVRSALIASIYLYESTGKTKYRTFVESRYNSVEPMSNYWWGPYQQPFQAALLRYTSMSGANSDVINDIRSQKANQNSVMSIDDYNSGTDLYRSYLPDPQYNWGHNMVRANVGLLNYDFATFNINPADASTYKELTAEHLHWLHGKNPLGFVMLSNMYAYGAENCANEIYHAWFQDGTKWDNALTSANGPAPGYVVGGPNIYYTGTLTNITNQPPQKAYLNWNGGWPENSWELNEPAIYQQAAYVQLLARVMITAAIDTKPPSTPTSLTLTGTPTTTTVSLTWGPSTDNGGVVVYDVYNNTNLLASGLSTTSATLSQLKCGTSYSLIVKARDASGNSSGASTPLNVSTAACTNQVTTLYADALNTAWDDWSWSVTLNFAARSPVKAGKRSISAKFTGWGGLSLQNNDGITTSDSSRLTFWAYASISTPLNVYIQSDDSGPGLNNYFVQIPAKKWTAVRISQSDMGNPNLIKRVNIQLNQQTSRTVYFDQIVITP